MHFQYSEWQWSDGSSAQVSWGINNLYPDHAALLYTGDYCPWCSPRRLHGSSKLEPQLPRNTPHCSTFMLSPHLDHFSVKAINCTMKFWNQILCVGESKNTLQNEAKYYNAGNGEYMISHNTLVQSNFVCPNDHNIVIQGMCIKITLIQEQFLKHNNTYNLLNAYTHHGMCRSSKSYAEILTNVDIDIYLIHDILTEFHAEGSELFLNYEIIDSDRHVWFAPPLYPTYVPCFTERTQVTYGNMTNNLEVFRCRDGSFVSYAGVCNGRADCTHSEDEQQCSIGSQGSPRTCFDSCTFPNCRCDMFYYQCHSGGCVHYDLVCDTFVDCPDGDDENGCHRKKSFVKFNEMFVQESYHVGLCDPPVADMLMCRSVPQCYSSSAICHYDHSGDVMAYCEDGSHLGTGSFCQYVECPQHYKCNASYCIPTRKLCDGAMDCPTGDDEANCKDFRCPGHVRCSGVSFRVAPHEVCDGIAHCPRQDDEKYCQSCPQDCHCSGTAIYCQQINNLTLNGELLSPSALVLHNSFTVFIQIYQQYWTKMHHVWPIDMDNGSFAYHVENKTQLALFFSVKVLHLTQQGFRTIPPYFINSQSMIYVNLSNNIIHTVKRNAFALIQNLQILALVCNNLRSLGSHIFSDLKSLSHLYLNDNELAFVAANVFQENSGLVLARSDWYMVCCVVIGVEDCYPQNQFVSSCSHLIASIVQKTRDHSSRHYCDNN